MVAANKSDLPSLWTARDAGDRDVVEVSAVTGAGIDALRSALVEAATMRVNSAPLAAQSRPAATPPMNAARSRTRVFGMNA